MEKIKYINEINYNKINCSEEISKFQIEIRDKFYGDLIYLNESTQKTKVNHLPYFSDYSTLNLEDNIEWQNSNIVMELSNED